MVPSGIPNSLAALVPPISWASFTACTLYSWSYLRATLNISLFSWFYYEILENRLSTLFIHHQFLDRAFFAGNGKFEEKLGVAVVSCRRGGASATFDQLNKYFTMNSMPVVSSQYWNQVHGFTPDDVRQDLEGMQTMRTLANNMAWLLKCIALGKKQGIEMPDTEEKILTNFIR